MNYLIFLLWTTSIGYALIFAYTLPRVRTAGTGWFMGILLISALWAQSYYWELALPDMDAKINVRLLRMFFFPWLSFCWLKLLGNLFGIGEKSTSAWVWRIWIGFNLVCMGIVATSPFHELFLHDFEIHALDARHSLLTSRQGPFYGIYIWTLNLTFWLLLFVMLHHARHASLWMRRQLLWLTGYLAIPLVLNTLYMLGYSPVPPINLTPFSMILSVVSLGMLVWRHRAFDLVPMARNLLLEELPDAVFVLDRDGCLADMNKAALDATGAAVSPKGGLRLAQIGEPWRSLLTTGKNGVQEVGEGESARSYDVAWMKIETIDQRSLGRVCRIREVTSILLAERIVAERRWIRQQQQILGDLHDGVGGLLATIAAQATLGKMRDQAALGPLERIEQLALTGSEEVRAIMNSLDAKEMYWADWLEQMNRYAERTLSGLAIRCVWKRTGTAPETMPNPVGAISLARSVKEAIHNAARHSGADEVRIDIGFGSDQLTIEVADNGRGLPEPLRGGRGIAGIRKRIRNLGGSVEFRSGRGLSVICKLPLCEWEGVDEETGREATR